MKTYEITFITKEDLKEKPVKQILENAGGRILSTSSLGQKSFTYPIKKEKAGFYTTVGFEIDPEKVTDLNKKLSMEEEILRFLIVSIKPTAKLAELPAKELATTEIIEEPVKDIVAEPVTEAEVEEETEEVQEPAKEEVKKEKTKKAVKPKAEKPKKVSKAVEELTETPETEEERMEELDKKLEELLKD
jgi:small subunit ribosomal protein S6